MGDERREGVAAKSMRRTYWLIHLSMNIKFQ